jgi:hypothetical protein
VRQLGSVRPARWLRLRDALTNWFEAEAIVNGKSHA